MSQKEDFLESENARLRALLKQAGLEAEASEVTKRLQRLLLSELHHRIKNMLAMVQSIVTQTLRSSASPAEAVEVINNRIGALARTHDIILSTAGEDSTLRQLLEAITAPLGPTRFEIDVPDAHIDSRNAVALALVVNELGTNAVKYGALSTPRGSVTIIGQKAAIAGDVVLTWTESGGPLVKQPTRRNFGTRLMQIVLPSAPRLEFRPNGLVCEVTVPTT